MLGVFTSVPVRNSLIILHVSTTWQRVAVGGVVTAATGDRLARSQASGVGGATTMSQEKDLRRFISRQANLLQLLGLAVLIFI